MNRRLFRKDHTNLATSINSMALFYQNIGKFEEARILFIEALKMRRKIVQNDHTDLATSINSMALFYRNIGKFEEARILFIEALKCVEDCSKMIIRIWLQASIAWLYSINI